MAKVYIEFTVYAIRDSEGTEFFNVATERSDTIFMYDEYGYAPRDAQGKQQSFESDAYHLEAWAKDFGFDYFEKRCKIPVDLKFNNETGAQQ